ncbi:MAG: MarR family winged helix-turn-helix transcriptional regulator [Actinomycetes bacterium]
MATDDPAAPPPLPAGLSGRRHRVANELNTTAIHALRRARVADAESGLSPERLSLLSVLVFGGPMPMSRLAKIEGVSPPAITRTVTALEADGLVTRRPVPEDRRQVRVSATARGRRLMEAGRRRRIEVLADLLSGATAAELDQLSRALHVVRRELHRQS